MTEHLASLERSCCKSYCALNPFPEVVFGSFTVFKPRAQPNAACEAAYLSHGAIIVMVIIVDAEDRRTPPPLSRQKFQGQIWHNIKLGPPSHRMWNLLARARGFDADKRPCSFWTSGKQTTWFDAPWTNCSKLTTKFPWNSTPHKLGLFGCKDHL